MLGACAGDIIGSRFEFQYHRGKDFELFAPTCHFTDDAIMTLAVAKALMESKPFYLNLKKKTIQNMQTIGKHYPMSGYGNRFFKWIFEKNPQPYNSFGNGAAMRISAVGFVAESETEVKKLSEIITSVSHNHPEGLKGAEATAMCVYLAKSGKCKEEIKQYVQNHYYDMNFALDEIANTYKFNESCQYTVPQALECFFESTNFEDCIRNGISIGGDSDTIAAIAGGIAEAYYGVPKEIEDKVYSCLTPELANILRKFESKYCKYND